MMAIQSDISHAFQQYEEQKFCESKASFEKLLQNEMPILNEIQLRFVYGYPLSALGLVDEAVDNYERLGELGKQSKNLKIVVQALHQIGMVYREAEQYDKAISYFEKEQKMIHKRFIDNHLFLAANLYEMGYTPLLDGHVEVAYSFPVDSLTESEKSKDSIMKACAERALGEFYVKQDKPVVAQAYFEASILSFKEAGDEIGATEVVELLEKLSDK